MPQPDGPALKIARARHHINDLVEQALSYYKNGNYRVLVQDNPQVGVRHLLTVIKEPVVDMFSPVVGDAIHNLRAALDLVVYEIVFPLLTPEDDETRIAFPMPRSEAGLAKVFSKDAMSRTPKAVQDEIVKSCHPTKGDAEILALHQLDIRDKHRVLLFLLNDISLKRFALQEFDPHAPSITMDDSHGIGVGMMFKGFSWGLYPHSPHPILVNDKIQKHIVDNMTFNIRFNEHEHPFALQSVTATLNRIADKVEVLIRNLREAAAKPA